MTAALIVAGTLIVVVGAMDVFLTVLNYDGESFLTSRLNRRAWAVCRWLATHPPSTTRTKALSLVAPLLLVLTVVTWVALLFTGFALIHYAGMREGAVVSEVGTDLGLTEAFYLSGTTISTLGYGDIIPLTPLYRGVAVMQAMAGFAILTMTLSYVLATFSALTRIAQLSALLGHHPDEREDVVGRVAVHFHDGEVQELSSWLTTLQTALDAYHEGLRRYPVVYYFHSRDPYRSLPYVFRGIGEALEVLQWGVPSTHPASRHPWVKVMIDHYNAMTEAIARDFLRRPLPAPPEPCGKEAFDLGDDPWVRTFTKLADTGESLAGLPDPNGRFERYREWLPFAVRRAAFVEYIAQDLAYATRPELDVVLSSDIEEHRSDGSDAPSR